jgi:protein gp37
MAKDTKIEWATHTFNPWIGCTKVSAACDHCYAEAWDKRGLQGKATRWGPHADRTITKTWRNPAKWQRKYLADVKKAIERSESGDIERPRVFCASLADIADNHKSILPAWRRGLVSLVHQCPNLDFLFLTKRPQNVAKLYPDLMEDWPENVWMGASTENREEMLRRGEALSKLPAKITFWSAEPLVGDLGEIPIEIMPSWIITGGENAKNYRPVNPDWFRSIRDQCADRSVPFLFKQWEGNGQKEIKAKGRELDGVVHDSYPQ